MTDNLTLEDDTPIPAGILAALQREAGIRLAGIALAAVLFDEDAAKKMLRPVLEAIGLIPYEHARSKWHYGEPA